MAHWAELNYNNEVLRVIVTDNNDPNNDEGYSWVVSNLGGDWVQTSYNNNFRKQFAGIGFTYDSEANVFVSPQPFLSWSLDANYDWQPPAQKPEGLFYWDEATTSWLEFQEV